MKLGFSGLFKLVVIATIAIITCIICYIILTISNDGKDLAATGMKQLKRVGNNYSNVAASTYDGNTILGRELVRFIEDTIERGDYLSVVVRTLESSRTDYNYTYNNTIDTLSEGGTTIIEESKAQGSYINRGAQFLGSVKKDANQNIICIWFEQMP
ncbi:MAG: hypothetical protein ACYDEX_20490 [Mobilitalea sp.]